jgi:uncharacterized protein YebE (UPF0316 family)
MPRTQSLEEEVLLTIIIIIVVVIVITIKTGSIIRFLKDWPYLAYSSRQKMTSYTFLDVYNVKNKY